MNERVSKAIEKIDRQKYLKNKHKLDEIFNFSTKAFMATQIYLKEKL